MGLLVLMHVPRVWSSGMSVHLGQVEFNIDIDTLSHTHCSYSYGPAVQHIQIRRVFQLHMEVENCTAQRNRKNLFVYYYQVWFVTLRRASLAVFHSYSLSQIIERSLYKNTGHTRSNHTRAHCARMIFHNSFVALCRPCVVRIIAWPATLLQR